MLFHIFHLHTFFSSFLISCNSYNNLLQCVDTVLVLLTKAARVREIESLPSVTEPTRPTTELGLKHRPTSHLLTRVHHSGSQAGVKSSSVCLSGIEESISFPRTPRKENRERERSPELFKNKNLILISHKCLVTILLYFVSSLAMSPQHSASPLSASLWTLCSCLVAVCVPAVRTLVPFPPFLGTSGGIGATILYEDFPYPFPLLLD